MVSLMMRLAIASVSRDHKRVWLSVADVATGEVRKVYEETVATQYESRAQWQVLWSAREFIWYSERDNWGQLYLYDLTTGRLKNKITTGEGPVMSIVRLDTLSRSVWYTANGRERGQEVSLPERVEDRLGGLVDTRQREHLT